MPETAALGLEAGVVRLAQRHGQWPRLFEEEKARLWAAIGAHVIDIQHVGSTAIPGVPAKPILDIGVAVHNFETAAVCVRPLEALGYEFKGEFGIARRHYFVKGLPRTHHLHINEIGSAAWENHILFRDFLRRHPEQARAYAALKQALSRRHAHDRDAYLEGKAPLIAEILALARAEAARTPLDDGRLAYGVRALASRDPRLAAIVAAFGLPPLWSRPPGFATLLQIILEQQVSLASARAAFERLLALASPLTPAAFLAQDDATLRAMGFSRQKAGYGRGVAQAILEGRLHLEGLAVQDDDAVREELMRLKGIGRWTANIYLLMALRRPDVWPVGDLALATAAGRLLALPDRPDPEELEAIGAAWRPWRAVAARLLWHSYLSTAPNKKEAS